MEHETFFTLLQNPAHWEFELFLMVVFDLIIGALLWPTVRKHWKHHLEHDRRHGVSKPKYVDIQRRESITDIGGDLAKLEELDLFEKALELAGVKFEAYDTYDGLNVGDEDKPDVEPFPEHDIVLVLEDSDTHVFFADGKLLGSAKFV
jgi:hypothetical protein